MPETEPNPWEQEADAAALRRAGIANRAGDERGERMPELFQWVPWFAELAKKVREGRQEGLVARAKEVDWAGGRCAVLAQGDEKADPLTFFLPSGVNRQRGGREGRRSTRALRRSSESRATSTTVSATASSFRRGTRGTSSSTTPEMIRTCFGTCSTRHLLVVLAASRTTPRSPIPSPNLFRSRASESRSSPRSSF